MLVREVSDRLAGALLRFVASADTHEIRRGDGWIAVATGVQSNDLNGVVSEAGCGIDDSVVDELFAWFSALAVPATWTITGEDRRLADRLVAAGAQPERTGFVCGRALDDELMIMLDERNPTRLGAHRLTVAPVTTAAELEDWLDVADRCGWTVDEDDRRARGRLYVALAFGIGPLTHWLARLGGTGVGMASSFVVDDVVSLCNLGVLPETQRRGIGTALAAARLADAAQRGVASVVAELSPDGWKLYRQLGFVSIPVRPDREFYLPMP